MKTFLYATLVGVINVERPTVGAAVVEMATESLQSYLNEGNWRSAKLMVCITYKNETNIIRYVVVDTIIVVLILFITDILFILSAQIFCRIDKCIRNTARNYDIHIQHSHKHDLRARR